MYCARFRQSARSVKWLVGLLLSVGLGLWGCTEPAPTPSVAEDRIGPVTAYVFAPDAQDYLGAPQPYALDPAMSPHEALTRLADHLSRTYFNRDADSTPPIHFEVLKVHRLDLPHRAYRLAVVNMVDPQLEARQVFFQGSAGGQTTFYMLTATLLQPQMEPPLADGLILLYNGRAFPEIDHVPFRGIVTPDAVRHVVLKALYRHRHEDPAATG